jgi:hypothetical protein
MKRVRFRRPSPAMGVALLSLFVALGGGAYAAVSLPENSVGPKQIKADAVRSSKVKDGSLLRGDFKTGQLPAGAQGLQGIQGSPGTPGLPGAPGAPGTPGKDATPADFTPEAVRRPRPATGTASSCFAPGLGTSVVDEFCRTSPDSAWTNYGGAYERVGYYKDLAGIVHLQGSAKKQGSSTGQIVFVLPVGYRPAASQVFTVIAGAAPGTLGFVEIQANGNVERSVPQGNDYLSLDGITFRAAG